MAAFNQNIFAKYPIDTISKATQACAINFLGYTRFITLLTFIVLTITITTYETNVEIGAAYKPMNFIKTKFTKKFTTAPSTDDLTCVQFQDRLLNYIWQKTPQKDVLSYNPFALILHLPKKIPQYEFHTQCKTYWGNNLHLGFL